MSEIKKVAVIGGGISGLSAAWLLRDSHEVELYEKSARLGGHANTVSVPGDSGSVPLDTGFLVFNELNYPNFTKFLKALNVEAVDSEMSLSIQSPGPGWEWAGDSLWTVFGQRRNLVRPAFYRMLFDVWRFGSEAQENLRQSQQRQWSLGELCRKRKFSSVFVDHYLLPMSAAIWSSPERSILEFPASVFLEFFLNHKLLGWAGRPQWKTVKQGSISYVAAAERQLRSVHLGVDIARITQAEAGPWTIESTLGTRSYDAIIFALHPGLALAMLQSPKAATFDFLKCFDVSNNQVTLHQDPRSMPKRSKLWSSWNVTAQTQKKRQVALTYYCNRLQPWIGSRDYFLTLNDPSVQGPLQTFDYAHPRFTRETHEAQKTLQKHQGAHGLYFAGAWTRYGFHEDGLLSALKVASMLGARAPWAT